jgi:hypothetical protein
MLTATQSLADEMIELIAEAVAKVLIIEAGQGRTRTVGFVRRRRANRRFQVV